MTSSGVPGVVQGGVYWHIQQGGMVGGCTRPSSLPTIPTMVPGVHPSLHASLFLSHLWEKQAQTRLKPAINLRVVKERFRTLESRNTTILTVVGAGELYVHHGERESCMCTMGAGGVPTMEAGGVPTMGAGEVYPPWEQERYTRVV